VPELLQREASGERMAGEVERLLGEGPARSAQLAGLAEVRASLGAPGAARRVAEEVIAVMRGER
jgi:lipid-A-disaccharide synthase